MIHAMRRDPSSSASAPKGVGWSGPIVRSCSAGGLDVPNAATNLGAPSGVSPRVAMASRIADTRGAPILAACARVAA